MGQVFLARHTTISQRVAIKALRREAFANEMCRERFLREAQILARLDHPSIVRLLGFHSLPEGCFLIMELAQGLTLGEMLMREGAPLAPRRMLPWIIQIVRGLGY